MADKWDQYAETPTRATAGEDKWAQFEEGRGTAGEPPVQSNGIYATLKKFLKGGYAPKEGDPGIELPFLKGSFQDTPRSQRQPIEPSIGDTLGYANDVSSTALIEGLKGLGGRGSLQKVIGAASDRNQRKTAPQQLLDDGWSKAGAYAVGIPLSILADPLGGFMSMRNPVKGADPYNSVKTVLKPDERTFGPAQRMKIGTETELGARKGWNTVEGELAGGPIASPLRQFTADAGEAGEKKLYENAFRKVNTAVGKKTNRQKDVPYFTDQMLKDRILKPGMGPGEMQQAFKDHMQTLLGDGFNDVWAKNSHLRANPEDVLNHPMFVEWMNQPAQKTALGKEFSKRVVKRVKSEALEANNHVFQTPEEALQGVADGIITADEYVKHMVASKKWTPLVKPKVMPGANPDELTALAKQAGDIATGTSFPPKSNIMKEGAISAPVKEGEMTVSNILRDIRNNMVMKNDPKSGRVLQKASKDYSVYKDSKDAVNALMELEKNRLKVTQLDGLAAYVKAPYYLVKNAIKYSNTPSGAVRIGDMLNRGGKSGIWDRVLKQYLQENEK